MSRAFVAGSGDGLGNAAAEALLDDGHSVVVRARTGQRLAYVKDLLDRGAEALADDLARLDEERDLAEQANASGRFDPVIHKAGVICGTPLIPVNVCRSGRAHSGHGTV